MKFYIAVALLVVTFFVGYRLGERNAGGFIQHVNEIDKTKVVEKIVYKPGGVKTVDRIIYTDKTSNHVVTIPDSRKWAVGVLYGFNEDFNKKSTWTINVDRKLYGDVYTSLYVNSRYGLGVGFKINF